MLLWKKLYGYWLAAVIECAYKSKRYDRVQYLCATVPLLYGGFGLLVCKKVKKHLGNIMGKCERFATSNTLAIHLDRYQHGFILLSWSDRKNYHVEYYRLMCVELRKGNLTWGRSAEDCQQVFDNLPPFAEK